ncbi:MAG: tetratricopeptide repeat protein [Alphaproteobacteria bacterium]
MTAYKATFDAAAQAFRRGATADAVALYQQVLASDPANVEALSRLAAMRAHAGEWAEAVRVYEQALVGGEDDADLWCRLGHAQQELGRIDQAIASFRQAAAREPYLPEPLIDLGVALTIDDRADEAETCYRAALDLDPHVGAAHLNLGSLLAKRGDAAAESAEAALRRATELMPANPLAWRELAALFGDMRRFQEAAAAFDTALTLDPNDSVAAYHAGHMYMRWRKPAEAVGYYEIAAASQPDNPQMQAGLAGGLQEAGEVDRALAIVARLLASNPDHADAHNIRGNCLYMKRDYAGAVTAYEEALRLSPAFGIAAYNAGNALRYLGRLDEALDYFHHACDIDPNVASAHNGVGMVHQQRGHHQAALLAFDRALEIEPELGDALNNKAVSLQNLGRYGEALTTYYQLLDKQPDRSAAYFNLGTMLQMLERWDESIVVLRKGLQHDDDGAIFYPYLLHAMLQQCNWRNLDAIIEKVRACTEAELASGHAVSITPFALQSLPAPFDMELRRQVAARTAQRAIAAGQSDTIPVFRFAPPKPGKKLRIGYVSPDFRFHSVAVSFKGILDAHDRENFEYYAYSLNTVRVDDLTQHFMRTFDVYRDIARLDHQEAADIIHRDEIDILVDLAGHTRGCRMEVFAQRPSPINVHYLGYSATTGADFIDYLVTDHRQVPPAQRACFSESLVYLPDVFMAGRRAEIADNQPTRADEGLPENGIVFANFNNNYKFEPRMFSIWMRLLRRVPDSVLWVMASSDKATGNLRAEAAARGVDPARVVFARKLQHQHHLARLRLADLCLDNLFHGGGITTIDALWAGVPVLSVAGETPQSRNGASLITAAGLPELICDSIEAFEAQAFRLATHADERAALRAKLAAGRDSAPLFDMPRLTRHLEAAYQAMWQRHCDGLSPDTIDVTPLTNSQP